MDWGQMGVIVNHQRRRAKTKKVVPIGYEIDHIIPYCISMDDSEDNLQIVSIKEHKKKTKMDFKILRIFRKKGWTEKITNYSIELMIPMERLKEEYLKEKDRQDT